MDIFRFRDFPVYILSRRFRKKWKSIANECFPKSEQFALSSQLWRALHSVLLNIAEGSDRYSDTDFSRFLNNALTSVNECVACFDAALDDVYISKKQHVEGLHEAEEIVRQLKAFSASVRSTK